MIKRKWVATALALSLGLGVSSTFVPPVSAAAVQLQSQFNITADVSVQAAQLAKFTEIKNYFSAQTVDLAQVKKAYEANFKEAVKTRNPQIDEEISFLLEAGLNGKATTGQVKQAVDKGLQWFFYEEINNLNRLVGDALAEGNKEKAKAYFDQAVALFENTILVTAGKRDENFGTLTQDFLKNVAVPGMQKAVENGDATTFHVYRQWFQKTMMKVFVLGTLRYAQQIPKDHAEGKTDEEKTHFVEGYFFFMPIHTYLAGGSQEAADKIRKAFQSGDGSQMNAEEIQTLLTRAVSAKVNEYAGKGLNELAAGNKDKALIYAAEGNAFLSQLEVIVKERLGAAAYTELEAHGQQYNEAVKAGNVNEAKKHAFIMLKSISSLSGVHFAIGGKTMTVMGKTKTNNEPTSYLDPKTNRTLGSARFISEALGATVEWKGSEQKVIIKKGDKTIEFIVGKSDVLINGEKSKDVTLDQPVVLKNGRTYIPVRAAAELLGGKVFYHNSEIVINY